MSSYHFNNTLIGIKHSILKTTLEKANISLCTPLVLVLYINMPTKHKIRIDR